MPPLKYQSVENSGLDIKPLNNNLFCSKLGTKINVYFVDHAKYFNRPGFYGDGSGDYPDNLDRFNYFCRQVLDSLKDLDFQPDVIHCHDWQTALIPVYLQVQYSKDAFYREIKSLLTIHNLAFQGVFEKSQYAQLGFSTEFYKESGFEFHNQLNFLKAGIISSDLVTTVSPQYAKEIVTKKFGCGLEKFLKARSTENVGILNGLDQEIWNPSTDRFITQQYSQDDYRAQKPVNKAFLQKELGFNVNKNIPLFGFVGRLSRQKGVDLILDSMNDLVAMNAQVAFLGVGDREYEDQLKRLAQAYPKNIMSCSEFNEPLGHQIYAGSDFFLMPSRFEPCGLSQMISLCYGTIPIVFKTGGLADTVKPFNSSSKSGNGFVFDRYHRSQFFHTIESAVKVFREDNLFNCLRRNAFTQDFSWDKSALCYQEIYHDLAVQS